MFYTENQTQYKFIKRYLEKHIINKINTKKQIEKL